MEQCIGLDVGTGNLIVARNHPENADEIVFKVFRNVFLGVDNDPIAKMNLKRQGASYVEAGENLYLLGDIAFDNARMFKADVRRPMANGVINSNEPEAKMIVQLMVESLVGKLALNEGATEGKAIFSIPANPIDADYDTVYHRGVFQTILENLGWQAKPINEGMAVVYNELADYGMTGIGISMGAGMANVAIAGHGFAIKSVINGQECDGFSIGRCGDWVDQRVFQSLSGTGITISKITAVKESPEFNLQNPTDDVENAIAHYYRELCEYLARAIAKFLNNSSNTPDFFNPVPVAIVGGSSMPTGVRELLIDELKNQSLPFKLQDEPVEIENPLNSVASGCYLASTYLF